MQCKKLFEENCLAHGKIKFSAAMQKPHKNRWNPLKDIVVKLLLFSFGWKIVETIIFKNFNKCKDIPYGLARNCVNS